MAKKRNRKPLRVRVFRDGGNYSEFDVRVTPHEAYLLRLFASALGVNGLWNYGAELPNSTEYFSQVNLADEDTQSTVLLERPDV